TKNTDMLTEMVRKHLSRTICEQYKNDKGRIPALTLEPALEHQLTASLRQEGDTLVLGLRAETAMQLTHRIAQAWKAAADKGVERPVLLCDSRLRYSLSAMLSRAVPLLGVLAYDEIVLGTEIEPVQTVSLPKEGQLETDEPVLAAQGKG
ncbi:MAG TPA: FHIPEP family type III secretion protein, partial [Anaerohalosphaeraceae bacterium]|nr:FHIPEP family type III secretion protein [Anaerohalosphaeraceae bacterium]